MQCKPVLTRRRLLGGLVAATALTGFPMINRGYFSAHAATTTTYSRRTIDLVKSSTVIDMLGVLKLDDSDGFYTRPLSAKDEAEFRASGLTCIHHSSGIAGPNAREESLFYLASQQGFVGRNSHLFTLIDKAADITRAKRDGKIAVITGLQNSEHFKRPEDVKMFYNLGQRVSQLTYNSQNLIGSGSTERIDGGISDFGAAIIAAMNETGMLIDVSHCGEQTTLDSIALSKGPLAITHSNCKAINNHPRNKTDAAITSCAAKGGVMGITGVRMFVSDKEPTTIVQMADHIAHVAKIAGIEHVGIGSDADLNGYDDMSEGVKSRMRAALKAGYALRDKADTDGFDNPMKVFSLVEELIRRNYSDAHIRAILGGNFLRLLTTVWGG